MKSHLASTINQLIKTKSYKKYSWAIYVDFSSKFGEHMIPVNVTLICLLEWCSG